MFKNKFILISLSVGIIAIAGAAIFTAMYLQQQGTESVAPNVPKSQPKAQQETLPSDPVTLTFSAGSTAAPAATATPTPTPVAASTPTPAPAAAGAPAATATPAPTPKAAATPKATATPKPAAAETETLPTAGVSLPTILAIAGGAILLLAGLILAL